MLSNTQTYGINQSLVHIPTSLFLTKKSEKRVKRAVKGNFRDAWLAVFIIRESWI